MIERGAASDSQFDLVQCPVRVWWFIGDEGPTGEDETTRQRNISALEFRPRDTVAKGLNSG